MDDSPDAALMMADTQMADTQMDDSQAKSMDESYPNQMDLEMMKDEKEEKEKGAGDPWKMAVCTCYHCGKSLTPPMAIKGPSPIRPAPFHGREVWCISKQCARDYYDYVTFWHPEKKTSSSSTSRFIEPPKKIRKRNSEVLDAD